MEEVNLSEASSETEDPGRPSGAILSLALGKFHFILRKTDMESTDGTASLIYSRLIPGMFSEAVNTNVT